MSRWDDYYPPRSTPRPAKGGIKARSKRGEFASSWWGKRWIEVLESFHLGARLSRGRRYARGGQVLSLTIDQGKVEARVQGSRPKPYTVSIRIKEIPAAARPKLAAALAERMGMAARLVAGEMPPEIEGLFAETGAPLFPARVQDLATDCSCPDWSNPCKHIAAVYYLLAEEFDRDPFLLLRLRGLPREEFAALLDAAGPASEGDHGTAEAAPEPLSTDPKRFWSGDMSGDQAFGELTRAGDMAAWLARLGNFPFWRGERDFRETVAAALRQGAERGVQAFLGAGEEAGGSGE